MRDRIVLDVSALPLHGAGTASPAWWATLAFMLIEGTGFALALAVYFYLMSLAPEWPLQAKPPDLWAGTSLTLLLLASLAPNILVNRWARNHDLRRVRIGLVIMTFFGFAPLVLRAFEFSTLNVRWDDYAYGSILWMLLVLHTTHILTDVVDTMVLACLMFSRHADNTRRYSDVQDNCLYWNFVTVTWLPLYGCIYGMARL